MDEFELIDTLLGVTRIRRDDVVTGPGDDAAVLRPPPGTELVMSTDTLVAGRHFPPQLPAAALGHRSLAVNLSDLAAMGAQPLWYLVALTVPDLQPQWARELVRGLEHAAAPTACALVGGNLARGELSVGVTVVGAVPTGGALLRSGARPGELVCVSGTVGAAAVGLDRIADFVDGLDPERAGDLPDTVARYALPHPRCELGLALRGLAGACIDISDGLLADLGHLARASGVDVDVELERVPLANGIEPLRALTAGDDYELLFTLPEERLQTLLSRQPAPQSPGAVRVSVIGRVTGPGEGRVRCLDGAGGPVDVAAAGYRHF